MISLERLCKEIDIEFKRDEPLKNYTTLRIGGLAKFIVYPNYENILKLMKFLKDENIPFFVIGKGSNLLVSDSGYEGVVINITKIKGIKLDRDFIEVMAGESLTKVVILTAKKGLSGLEGLIGIPGSVGGAIKGNAGSFGYEISGSLEEIEVVTEDCEFRKFKGKELDFGYRKSGVKDEWIITKSKFKLNEDPAEEILKKVKGFMKKRIMTQPVKERSAGCVFKNPEGFSAGALIEQVGLKGFRVGDIMVSRLHANYFINIGDGKASDFLKLLDIVRDKVFRVFNIELEPEIKFLGV
ncbi:MAG: UDP-N-acetylmuramate dehydrogenase [Thermodesulfovibrio sp.]|nr:UDP-N-acetylmuramate dehydrogenase [Thermodesulfovibrio sp.]